MQTTPEPHQQHSMYNVPETIAVSDNQCANVQMELLGMLQQRMNWMERFIERLVFITNNDYDSDSDDDDGDSNDDDEDSDSGSSNSGGDSGERGNRRRRSRRSSRRRALEDAIAAADATSGNEPSTKRTRIVE